MHKEFLMGNAAIALELLLPAWRQCCGRLSRNTIYRSARNSCQNRPDDVYVEWSVNEKPQWNWLPEQLMPEPGQW